MLIAVLIISSITLIISIAAIVIAVRLSKLIVAIAYGLQECDSFAVACYQHLNYTNSAIKLFLDDLEDKNNVKLQHAIDTNKFEMATYYKSVGENIIKLKTMTNEDIERAE